MRRKLKPTHVECSLFGESDGSSLKTFTTPLGVIGALCCWEHIQPLTRYVMYAQHEQIHITAWLSFRLYRDATVALSPEINIAFSRSYVVEGQCFVIAPCAIVSEQMIEQLCTDETKRNLLKAGGGYVRIFPPDGSELTAPLAENEKGLLLAMFEPAAITYAKAIADPVGHYSRPDVTCLLFNPAANRPLSTKTASFIARGNEEFEHIHLIAFICFDNNIITKICGYLVSIFSVYPLFIPLSKLFMLRKFFVFRFFERKLLFLIKVFRT